MKRLEFKYLPLDKIDISISNVRRSKLEKHLDELAQSIDEIGLQQPVVVFPKGDRYELVIGQRRYLACKMLGWKKIPALITAVRNRTEATIASFSENIQRVDLDYRDKMQAAIELLDKLGSVAEVAKRLGVTPQTVRNYLGYAGVPEPIKGMVAEGKLGATTARYISKHIPDEEMAVRIAEKVTEVRGDEDRKWLVQVARENPKATPDEVVRISEKTRGFKKLTINLTPRVADALERASKDYRSDPKDIAIGALEEWLENEGFI